MSMRRLIAVEFFKLRKRMMTWIVTLLLVGLVILLYSVLWSISGRVTTFVEDDRVFTGEQLRRALFLETSVPFSLQVVTAFGTLLAVILASGAAGSEYAWGTVRLMATVSSGRIRYIAAKLIVVFAMVWAGALLGVAVGLAYSTIITTISGGADFGFVTWDFVREQAMSYVRSMYVMAPYVALAFAAAIVGRSTLAGVGTGLAFAFLEPLISSLMRLGGNPWNDIPNYLLNANMQVILLQNDVPEVVRFGTDPEELAQRNANSPEGAAFVLLVYIVAFISVALITYRRRDITAGG